MICACICKCPDEACGDTHYNPKLCIACNLCEAWGNSHHGLPYVAPVVKPIEPAVPVSNEQLSETIEKATENQI